ncbi:MAG: flagellin, partial [Chitinivibrionales bacterium]|nr:flagellin [Chitinivibrionales bacterium]
VSMPANDMTAASLGIEGTSIATQADANAALASLDTALTQMNSQRTDVGAMYNRFESTMNNLSVSEINTQAAESVLRDQDMAKGLTELVRTQLLQEGGMKAFSRFNQISANHLMGLIG